MKGRCGAHEQKMKRLKQRSRLKPNQNRDFQPLITFLIYDSLLYFHFHPEGRRQKWGKVSMSNFSKVLQNYLFTGL